VDVKMNYLRIAKDFYLMGCDVSIDESMNRHTTFKIGGKVPLFVKPKTKKIFINVLNYLLENNYLFKIIGGGANIIVADKPLNFIVLSTEYLNNFTIKNDSIIAEVGISLSRLSYLAMENSLSGLEFAVGIPGSLGGALFMNAGAYGGQIKDVVEEVEAYDMEIKQVITLKRKDIKFDYRKSIFQERKYISLAAKLKLHSEEKRNIEKKVIELSLKRWEKQPLEYPSAGSIFKRPKPDFYVGTTIEKLGLKGFSIGDAEISNKHAGFIINKGNAKFEDVINIIKYVKNIVKEKYGVELEVEPEIWG
jgi:UDP-N-acetylmuramate dehydrogenase